MGRHQKLRRILGGILTGKSDVYRIHPDEVPEKHKILRLYSYRGIQRVEVEEAGAGTIEVMRTIKRALDPKNILNPGKIFSLT